MVATPMDAGGIEWTIWNGEEAKLLILRHRRKLWTVYRRTTNQKVACSNHAGRTNERQSTHRRENCRHTGCAWKKQ